MAQVSHIANEQTSTPISSSKSVTLRIARYNPEHDDSSKFMEFTIPYERWTTVLEAILEVKKHLDHSVAVRYSCRQATCGSCGMMINGKPRLACFTKISELNSDVITVEPMNNFPIIRDLAVKFERLFDTHHKIKPYLIRDDADLVSDEREFLQSPEEVEQYIQFANCIKCGLCNSACPTMATDSSFVGPQALAQAYRYVADSRDKGKDSRLKIIDESHGIWRCHFAGSCSQVCPKGVDPAMGIQLLRGYLLGFRG
ncbi:MAG: succinate dehydrogenase/fumarate reductase iron-sulfur subunit [Nitrosopumilus sp.]|uniref:succinate dehydrogenase n=1 Tax=Nitrosopumilus zosterae TaxID=718286 RepID=A0A2S2KQD3_9ARCH|nr:MULTISPECIES: succinate dehydrogenase/fumarate reductase iron-sulfur subunit [Nitrosopumilus]MCV0366500.1 succinate dehydrogenase/fumarate reductase iron-sulfur subunit [Nitrosopumilus sp.]BDQ31665.1 succinate dehydrogenase/fumarate reductase iron-sulfur subunit [Nitrosopumilus zosterae]GBH33873.1 succinate dehydrogenase iron-sulfur subunit [Nitrosopumilus zosterae]